MSDSSEEESPRKIYPLHDAAEVGDIAAMRLMLRRSTASQSIRMEEEDEEDGAGVDAMGVENGAEHVSESKEAAGGVSNSVSDDEDDIDYNPAQHMIVSVDSRDKEGCTPLHVALLHCQLGAVRVMLEAGSDPNRSLEGSTPAHIALSVGAVPQHAEFSLAALRLLLDHGADRTAKDDRGQTLLHISASLGRDQCVELLMERSAAAESETGESGASKKELDARERLGLRPLHIAASNGHASTTSLLLRLGADPTTTTIHGNTALHLASARGRWTAARVLLDHVENASAGGAAKAAAALNRQLLSPGMLAEKRGLAIPNELLELKQNLEQQSGGLQLKEVEGELPDPTLLYHHATCLQHYSCRSITRSGPEPPPENVKRLEVIYSSDTAVLKAGEFKALEWDGNPPRAAIADVLRVHDFTYVDMLQKLCASIPSSPPVTLRYLDGDTALSQRSFEAAMHAAGSVCGAVDRVCGGARKNRNAFCAVRPPGHHTGPRGVVTCENDGEGSHGFCLLNNVGIGAAYARHMYRGPNGVKKVAIVDFDVHHGNGTEELVRGLVPTEQTAVVKTPFCHGVLHTTHYSPWLDENDAACCLFASVHGYGKKDPAFNEIPGGWFYPGSGSNSAVPQLSVGDDEVERNTVAESSVSLTTQILGGGHEDDRKEEADVAMDEVGGGGPHEHETHEHETHAHETEGEGSVPSPMILNIGMPLSHPSDTPGKSRFRWREAYRKKIFPALVRFNPDLILISAGFDAHQKDSINFGFIGLLEEDYEWVTGQLVQVANRCCEGRVVSVLEGGYRIQGGPVSAFGRSVAAHVRALLDGCTSRQLWSETDAEWESGFEDGLLKERERKRKAKQEQQLELERQRKINRQREAAAAAQLLKDAAIARGDAPTEEVAVEHASGEADDGTRKRRRTTPVDYVALAKEIDKEAVVRQ